MKIKFNQNLIKKMVESIENMENENQREETFVFKNINPEDPYAYLNKI